MKNKQDKKEMTVRELAAMGGKARAKSLTKARRKKIAKDAAKARWDAAKTVDRGRPKKKLP